jgi:hypothetical protein
MSTSPIQSASGVQSLAETLTRQFDTDGNGQLSAQEFTSVLTRALSNNTSVASVPKSSGTLPSAATGPTNPRALINQILNGYPDTAAGLSKALPELLSALLGVRLADVGGTASVAPPPSAGASSSAPAVSGDPFTGVTPRYPFEGFNFEREQNPGKSAKDAFAYLANQAPPPPFEDKAALGEWFRTHIQPGMDQLGHKVLSVQGDTFTMTNWQGTGTVDFVRGAGAPGAAFHWGA